MKSMRLWYKKSGTAIYTSHLDMNRCFARAVIRADIPLWYTEGFNPHPYMTFLAPLPLGQVGKCEPIDIKIDGEITADEIKDRLNSVLPAGLEIVKITEPVQKANEIAFAEYKIICIFDDKKSAADFADKAKAVIESGELLAEKRSKRGIKTVNLCPMVTDISFKSVGTDLIITAKMSAGCSENLNPKLFTDSLGNKIGYDDLTTKISREKLIDVNGNDFT